MAVTNGINNSSNAFTSVTTLTATSGAITATSGNVVITAGNLTLPTSTSTTGIIMINAIRYLHNFGGTRNTFVGETAGNLTASGANQNVGIGFQACLGLTSGDDNVGVGISAVGSVTSGLKNIGIGSNAMSSITTTSSNIGIGNSAGLFNVGGSSNVIIGESAAATASWTGSNNVVIGASSGSGMNGAHSHNLYIQNAGAAESNTIRIGTTGTGTGQQSKCYLAAVNGVTVTGTAVLAATDGLLGTVVSSRKYKENIEDMGVSSDNLYKLRPVTFDLKANPEMGRQVGLIAEEVYEVYPNLVVLDQAGEPQSVKYHELPAMLLNELQKALKRIEILEEKLAKPDEAVGEDMGSM